MMGMLRENKHETAPPRVDRAEAAPATDVKAEMVDHWDGTFSFPYRGNFYEATFASDADVSRLLRGARDFFRADELKAAERLNSELKAENNEFGWRQAREDAQAVADESRRELEGDFRQIVNFFVRVTGRGALTEGGRAKRLFKLKGAAHEALNWRYKDTFKGTELNPALNNKNYLMSGECLVLSPSDAVDFKNILKGMVSERFKVQTEFDDGFVAYLNGLEIVFLTPPEVPSEEGAVGSTEMDAAPEQSPIAGRN